MPTKKPMNPFYVVLVLTGIAFVLTAVPYGILLFRSQHRDPRSPATARSEHGLLAFVDRYGNRLFLGEIVILGVATVGAITTDQYWMRRAFARRAAAEESGGEGTAESVPGEKTP
jgi:hypothetical protein